MAETDDNRLGTLSDELGDVRLELERIDDLADGVGRSLSNGFRSAVLSGKSLNTVLKDIALSFSNMALKAALQPVSDVTSSLVSSLFSAANPAVGGVTAFAKGGVIAQPSYFPTGSGLGLAGEAGREAVLPLARDSSGRLGVAGASSSVSVAMTVNAQDAQSFAASEAEVSAMLLRAVKRGRRGS